jgi:hypothetical protein
VKTQITKLLALAILCAALCQSVAAKQAACATAVGNPSGNYIVPGVLGNVKYREEITLDAYAPAGTPRPAAILIHGGQGDKSTHLTQLFEVLARAGFAWFSVNYRGLEDVRAAVAYVRCAGRFNINGRLVLIAEDAGAPLAARIAQEIKASGLALFGAQVTGNIPDVEIPVLRIRPKRPAENGRVANFSRSLKAFTTLKIGIRTNGIGRKNSLRGCAATAGASGTTLLTRVRMAAICI